MDDQPAPTHLLSTEWGTVIVTCSHPMHVKFATGHGDTTPLVVNHVDYRCSIVINRTDLPADEPHNHEMLGGGWHVTRPAIWYALRRDGNRDATDAARRTFTERILPTFHRWLATDDARALLADGHQHWRHEFAEQAKATEADLVAAFQRLQAIATRVAEGDTISATDEDFATRARVGMP